MSSEWQICSHHGCCGASKFWHTGIQCMFSLTLGLETSEVEEERDGENTGIISVKQTQFSLSSSRYGVMRSSRNNRGKNWGSVGSWVENMLVARQKTGRHQSSDRGNFSWLAGHLLSIDFWQDPVSMPILKYAPERTYAVSKTGCTLHKVALENRVWWQRSSLLFLAKKTCSEWAVSDELMVS